MNRITDRQRNELRQLGNQCRQVRLFSGYSQQEVAREIGVHPTVISNFESGKANNALVYRWYIYAEETYCKARFENSLRYFKRRDIQNDKKSDESVCEISINGSEITQNEVVEKDISD